MFVQGRWLDHFFLPPSPEELFCGTQSTPRVASPRRAMLKRAFFGVGAARYSLQRRQHFWDVKMASADRIWRSLGFGKRKKVSVHLVCCCIAIGNLRFCLKGRALQQFGLVSRQCTEEGLLYECLYVRNYELVASKIIKYGGKNGSAMLL